MNKTHLQTYKIRDNLPVLIPRRLKPFEIGDMIMTALFITVLIIFKKCFQTLRSVNENLFLGLNWDKMKKKYSKMKQFSYKLHEATKFTTKIILFESI